jgi:four helix bundle protein
MSTINRFEDLEIWLKARELCKKIRSLSDNNTQFSRDYALKDQMNRSSGSIMDNIAEGYGRGGNKEFVNFLSISLGSCNETKSQLYRASDFNYITDEEKEQLFAKIDKLSSGIMALINYLRESNMKGIKYK